MIEGVEIDVGRDAVWLRSAAPLRVLASAVVGGALDVTRHVVNMHVRRGYDSIARSLGITEPFVGLMTAAEGALPSSPDAICRARRVPGRRGRHHRRPAGGGRASREKLPVKRGEPG